MTVALRVEQLTVAFGGLKALDKTSLTFEQGQICGLIGPNGSGKSTLVNTVSGQIRPSAGTIRLQNTEIGALRSDQIVRMGLARTYQIPRVPPQLTVQEVIRVPLHFVGRAQHLLGTLHDERSIARFCALDAVFDRRCGELTVPDLRRLEVARALACGPAVLLLDEVMAGLSRQDAAVMTDVIRRVHEAGVTIIIIEHVMSVISALCQHVLVLNQGALLASGEARDVLSDPIVREAYLGKGFKL
ncbi:MAG: ABC transporter ATP-binding protein [Burkholderiales bacterium]